MKEDRGVIMREGKGSRWNRNECWFLSSDSSQSLIVPKFRGCEDGGVEDPG